MFTLEQVVPWGRSFDEYVRMFALDELVGEPDLRPVKILGCADGPASFNAEATRRGMQVVSADPLYRLTAAAIRERIATTYDQVIEQTQRNAHQFVWDVIPSVDELGRVRMRAMQTFLDDFAAGKRQGRYVDAELPSLPFPDQSFDVALCSHFLFSIPTTCRSRFIAPQCANSAGSPLKSGSFPYSRSTDAVHPTSRRSWTSCAPPPKSRWSACPTNSSAAGTR